MSYELRPDGVSAVCRGATESELFEVAAAAMFSLGFEIAGVPPRHSRPLVAPGDRIEELLVNWLEELLVLSHEEQIVFSYFTVDRLEEGGVQGSAAGMPIDQVVRSPRQVDGVDEARPPIVVEVPDGFWVEVAFVVGPRLRIA